MKPSHIDEKGRARMVDVSAKAESEREAKAYGKVTLSREAYAAIKSGDGPKGDILTVAKIAGIMASKKTSEIVPLCHPLAISAIDIRFEYRDRQRAIEVFSSVRCRARTGVEMEALAAVMLASLTIYDMCKALDKSIQLGPFYLLEKSGGKSGGFRRQKAK
ncbi:MAG: cyclic pyranopterin monophosphate synthase MoaC [Deltaproteobacteria bacterium]|nr:cyclic pyranopterin monophosphate synthase MoaC [Deltaproteobacteria bacterium]